MKEFINLLITRAELRLAIVAWIERTYHHRRREARLGRLAPIEFDHKRVRSRTNRDVDRLS